MPKFELFDLYESIAAIDKLEESLEFRRNELTQPTIELSTQELLFNEEKEILQTLRRSLEHIQDAPTIYDTAEFEKVELSVKRIPLPFGFMITRIEWLQNPKNLHITVKQE